MALWSPVAACAMGHKVCIGKSSDQHPLYDQRLAAGNNSDMQAHWGSEGSGSMGRRFSGICLGPGPLFILKTCFGWF